MRDWRAEVRTRLASGQLDPAGEAEIVEELGQHLEDQFTELRHRGVSEDDADRELLGQVDTPGFSDGVLKRRRARRAEIALPIGGSGDVGGWVASAWQDVRYGARALRRSPAFTIVAVLSLGLGIGANTAIFGLLNAVLLERLPVSHPERLVAVQWTAGTKKMLDRLTYAEYAGLKQAPGLPALAGATGNSVTVVARNARDYYGADAVTGGYFEVVGVRPLLGRTISLSDDATSAPVVVVSEDFWRQRFDADPAALGQTISLNDQPFTIIGVLPRAFHGLYFGATFSMAVPLGAAPLIGVNDIRESKNMNFSVVARLGPGMTREAASAALDLAYQRCCASFSPRGKPNAFADPDGANAAPKAQLTLVDASRGLAGRKLDLRGQYRRILVILMAGVSIVLLIACANVGNLLLARAAARQRELAVRMSMGATRSRIVRQLLTESLELAIAGGLLGLLLAQLGTRLLSHNLPPMAATLSDRIPLGSRPIIFAFTAAITIGCALLFGAFPAVRATRADIISPLKDGAKGSGGRSRWSLDRGLVVAQVALAIVLVSGAALFVATLRNLRQFDGGYRTTHVLLASVDTRGTSYESRGMNAIYPAMLERAARIPGVQRVATATTLPVFGGRRRRGPIAVPGYEAGRDEDMGSWVTGISPGFFLAAGIGLQAGRDFGAHDLAGSERVAIVSSAFAKRFFAGRDPIGGSIVVPASPPIQMRVVGVANDARYDDLRAPPTELYYAPLTQFENAPFLNFVVGTSGNPVDIAPRLTREIDAIAPGVRVLRLAGVEQVLDEALARERLSAALATLFGVFALGLAAVGLYGVVAYNVSRRTSEIGIRMALGARPVDAVWLVVRQTLLMTIVGVGVGVPLALVAARGIGTQLYGIAASDPRAMIGAAVLLAAAGAAASIVPSRRAARIDPVEALRAD